MRTLLTFWMLLTAASLSLAAPPNPPANAAKPEAPAATEFIRVAHDKKTARLQTAITRYSKGDTHVDLIGAVHIADKAYYDKLNRGFKAYPVLLFEMVGGENIGKPVPAAQAQAQNDPSFKLLGAVYNTMQNMLGLTGQSDHINYLSKNFVHADLTLAEFQTLQKQRKESILSFAIEQAMHAKPAKKQPSSLKLLLAIVQQNPDKLKLEIVDTLGEGDNQIAAMAGDNVIITDRNLKCLQVMQAQIDKGHKKIGIFYGAAHFPDMEKRLIEQGYKQTKHQWIDAWVIDKVKAGAAVDDEAPNKTA